MISHFYSDSLGKEFQFLMGDENDNNNAFTIIVGKNGVGKSRLLNDVINAHLSNKKERVMPPISRTCTFR